MPVSRYLLLFLFGLAILLAVAAFQPVPGYMDADYYFAGGIRLAQGFGFSEPYLWNYLDDPTGLPHPSHAYWMPLASLLAAAGLKLAGTLSFAAGRAGFVLAAACIPPITARLAFSLTGRSDWAALSGILAVFPAFYLPFMPVTDTFGIYMLLGALWLLVAGEGFPVEWEGFPARVSIFRRTWLSPLLLGLLSGLMHLSRADGLLWLLLSFIAVLLAGFLSCKNHPFSPPVSRFTPPVSPSPLHPPPSPLPALRSTLLASILVLTGYLILMGPWILRNLEVFGVPFSPGGGRALWLTGYDELFNYPAGLLTPQRWLATGLVEIAKARLWAAGQNLQSALAVQGVIFLAPLILVGLWRLRRDRRVWLGSLAWVLTFLAMTLAFPFAGARGGFFHSGAALQPLFWAAAPVGLDAFVDWGRRKRGWQMQQAMVVFGAGLVGLSLLLTVFVSFNRVIGPAPSQPTWGKAAASYARLESALQSLGAGPDDILLANNPPGYFVVAGRQAIYTPNGGEEAQLAAARRYSASYLLVEPDHPRGLDELYTHPGDRPGLEYLADVEGTRVFRITVR